MIRTCPSCGRPNRIPARNLVDSGRCGACRQSLPPANVPLDVDPTTFDEVVSAVAVPVLVDFWAPWCGPCRAAAPAVAEVAASTAGRALVLKVNTDDHPDLAARFGVRGIPTFVVLRKGQVAHRQSGLATAEAMQTWLAG